MSAAFYFLWDYVLVNPMTNALIALDHLLPGPFGVSLIAFTILMRAATFPLTMRQLRSTRAMSELQPKLQELQKKYKDPKRRSQETMKLYKEAGVNPLGCIFPMLIQLPIWFALYQVIQLTLSGTPEDYIDLSGRVYPISYIQHAVPLSESFLWMHLGQTDPFLPFLVGASMWVQQRGMMVRRSGVAIDPQQQQMNNMMLWMMPLMFTWFSLAMPAGLTLYWFATNVIGVILNGFVFGWQHLHPKALISLPSPAGAARPAPRAQKTATSDDRTVASEPDEAESEGPAAQGEEASDGRQGRSKRKNRRRGRRTGPPRARP